MQAQESLLVTAKYETDPPEMLLYNFIYDAKAQNTVSHLHFILKCCERLLSLKKMGRKHDGTERKLDLNP